MAARASSAAEAYQLFNVRLPPTIVERIHTYASHLNETQPGIDANASMAVRMLLMKALDQVESELGIKGAKAAPRDPLRAKKP